MRISITEHTFMPCVSHKPGGSVFLGYIQKAKLNFHDESGATCTMNVKLDVRKNRAGKLSLAAPALKVWKNDKGEDVYPRAFSFDDATYEAIKQAVAQLPEVIEAWKVAEAAVNSRQVGTEQVAGLTTADPAALLALLQRVVSGDIQLPPQQAAPASTAEVGVKIG